MYSWQGLIYRGAKGASALVPLLKGPHKKKNTWKIEGKFEIRKIKMEKMSDRAPNTTPIQLK